MSGLRQLPRSGYGLHRTLDDALDDGGPVHVVIPGTFVSYCGLNLRHGAKLPWEESDDGDKCAECLRQEGEGR